MSLTLHQGVLNKYMNPVFIETGAYMGGGIEAAVAANFQRIYSIEISQHYYDMCRSTHGGNSKVKVILGDSAVVLPELLKEIDQQITFWIDAHQPLDGAKPVGNWKNCPALLELEAIAQHPIKTHTIMIDDRFDFGTALHDGITEEQLKAKLLQINPNYKFVYEIGALKDSVIVALP
jgi:hypothetical protein